MKIIVFTLALFSCGQEDLQEVIENNRNVDLEEPEDKQETSNPNVVKLVCKNENTTATYDRSEWGNWSTKGDLQNVRHQVLFEESLKTGECEGKDIVVEDDKVTFGCWKDMYSNEIYHDSSDLDIDHLVPLKEAFESGAYNWHKDKKKDYYNNMLENEHLLAVSKGLNRSKGSKDVSEWLPTENIKQYVTDWINIKHKWSLTIDSKELEVLKQYSNDERLPSSCN